MLRVKTDAQGNPIKDENGQYVFETVPDPLTQEQITAQIETAARTAAAATRAELETAQREREQQLEQQMRAREEEARRQALAQLPPDQQVTERLRLLEESNRELARQRAEDARIHGQQLRNIELVAYRERALRDVPASAHAFVVGASEEEIDAAQEAALAAHNQIVAETEARIRAEFEAGQRSAQPGAPVLHQPPQQVPVVVAGPRTPHVVAPAPVDSGYPSVNNAPNPAVPVAEEVTIPEMTTEEAVRSGKYGGEMRQKILNSVKNGGRYVGQLGATPRHWSQQTAPQVPHTQQPGDVQQPTGLPTPTPQHPQQRQAAPASAPAPAAPGVPVNPNYPVGSAAELRAQAAAANASARAGDGEISSYVAHRPAASSPQSTYSGRFQHTPPASQGAN